MAGKIYRLPVVRLILVRCVVLMVGCTLLERGGPWAQGRKLCGWADKKSDAAWGRELCVCAWGLGVGYQSEQEAHVLM